MDFAAIDFETATQARHSACSVGVAIVSGGEIVAERDWLIRPPGNVYSPWNITIHGITPEQTADALAFDAVWAQLEPFVGRRALVAHNAPFDLSVLRASLNAFELPYPETDVWCSIVASRRAFPGYDRYGLAHMCETLGLRLDKHHDAAADAAACARLLLRCADESGASDLTDLAERLQIDPGRIFERGYENCRSSKTSRRRRTAIA